MHFLFAAKLQNIVRVFPVFPTNLRNDTITLSVANNNLTNIPHLADLSDLEELRMDNNLIKSINHKVYLLCVRFLLYG